MRDDFSQSVKELLAKRVNYLCSNPKCLRQTLGPHSDQSKFVSVGVAAHITAAAPGGKRYDRSLSKKERMSSRNGIWLCTDCAKIIDTDEVAYPVDLLQTWKRSAETLASKAFQSGFSIASEGSSLSLLYSINADNQELVSQINTITEKELEDQRQSWREGKREDAQLWISSVKTNDTIWLALPGETKGKILNFEAAIGLDSMSDINHVQILINQAGQIAPSVNQVRLRAMLTYKMSGPIDAIKLLDEQTDIDGLNLKAALYLETGEIQKCEEIFVCDGGLDALTKQKPNAEVFRIRALLHLVKREIDLSRLAIRKALELQPKWESIRITAALINYFCVIVPAALPARLMPWPEPVDWRALKRDNDSVRYLREATETFKELIESHRNNLEIRQTFESWFIACLLNDAMRQDEAIACCQNFLKDDPAHYRIVAWVTSRNLDIDLRPSIHTLENLIRRKNATAIHVVILVSCYLIKKRSTKAIKLLQQQKNIFLQQKGKELWHFWNVQSYVVGEDIKGAARAIKECSTEINTQSLEEMILHAQFIKDGKPEPLIEYLESIHRKTNDPIYLLEACEVMAQGGNWKYVSERADILIKEVQSIQAVRLTAISTLNNGDPGTCLKIIDDHIHIFPDRQLPSDLRRVRIQATRALGLLPDALAEAEKLAHDDSSTTNILNCAQLYFETGDLKGLATNARLLIDRTDVTSEQLLNLVRLVNLGDHNLACALWRKAMNNGIPDSTVSLAFGLAFQLGLEKEIGSLHKRMADLSHSSRHGVKMFSLDDLISLIKNQREHTEKIEDAYNNGIAPIHLIVELANKTLVELYHWSLTKREQARDPQYQSYLLARHGGKLLMNCFPQEAPSWNLHLDITSILLAEHLGIFDFIEKSFTPIMIPMETIPALLYMQERMKYHQPSRLEEFRAILNMIEMQKIFVIEDRLKEEYENHSLIEEMGMDWVSLLENARIKNGYLVDFLPLIKNDRSGPPSALSREMSQLILDKRAVIESLYKFGPLTSDNYKHALEANGYSKDNECNGQVPTQGKNLLFHFNTIEGFSSSGMLDALCERFTVYIEKNELDHIKAELDSNQQTTEVFHWLGVLIDRLRSGVDKNVYSILPAVQSDKKSEDIGNDLESKCLRSLFQYKVAPGDVIWSDDRFMNSYAHRDGAPIVGVNEILKGLVAAGSINEDVYYEKISRLRAGNVLFVPVLTEEILYHIRHAHVHEGTLVETDDLIILRRYISYCLSKGHLLQRQPMQENAPNRDGEIAFIISLGRALNEALVEIWWDENEEERILLARSEWVLNNLLMNHLAIFEQTGLHKPEHDDLFITALSLSILLTHAIQFKIKSSSLKETPRQKYFRWLYHRVLRMRFEADPHLPEIVANQINKTLQSMPIKSADPQTISAELFILQSYFHDLPEPIREALSKDHDFMESIGLKYGPLVTVAEHSFEAQTFYSAVLEAINGREVIASTTHPEKRDITFMPMLEGRSDGFCIINPSTNERLQVVEETIGILRDSINEQQTFLKQHRSWFDVDEETYTKISTEILSIRDARGRMDEIQSWRDRSMSVHYQTITSKIRKTSQINLQQLDPPTAEGILGYLRIPLSAGPGAEFKRALEIAATLLIAEEGLSEAIKRLFALPVPLPDALLDAVTQLSREKRRSLIKRILRTSPSPVSRIHLIRIISDCLTDSPSYLYLLRRIVRGLLSDEGKECFGAFSSVLKYFNEEFTHSNKFTKIPYHIRLAACWAHSNQIFSIFVFEGTPIKWIEETFSISRQRLPSDVFKRDPEYWFNIIHPRRINRLGFLLSGIGYSFGQNALHIVNEHILGIITEVAFPVINGKPFPSHEILLDPSLFNDSVNSFLSGDRGEKLAPLLGNDLADMLSKASLETSTLDVVKSLIERQTDFSLWALLHALIGELPPPKEVAEHLKSLMRKSDLLEIYHSNVEAGQFAVLMLTQQLINLKDEGLRQRFRSQLIALTKYLADNLSTTKISRQDEYPNKIQYVLVKSAFNISVAVEPPRDSVEGFQALLTDLVKAWPAMIPACSTLVNRFCEELPIVEAKKLYHLLVRIRLH